MTLAKESFPADSLYVSSVERAALEEVGSSVVAAEVSVFVTVEDEPGTEEVAAVGLREAKVSDSAARESEVTVPGFSMVGFV